MSWDLSYLTEGNPNERIRFPEIIAHTSISRDWLERKRAAGLLICFGEPATLTTKAYVLAALDQRLKSRVKAA